MDEGSETIVFDTVMTWATHASLAGWDPMPKHDAELRVPEAVELFAEGPWQFETHSWTRGFYATLYQDYIAEGSLAISFAGLLQIKRSPVNVPPPPPDFLERIMRPPTEEEQEKLQAYRDGGIKGLIAYQVKKHRS